MAFAIPIAGFLTAQFPRTCVGNVKWFEKLVKMLCIWNIKNKFLQSFRILESIIYSFIYSFYMEITLKVFQIIHKEIEKIFAVSPVTEQNSKFVHLLILSFDSPEMVESLYYPYKSHII